MEYNTTNDLGEKITVTLVDDGTLDTVVEVTGPSLEKTVRFSQEYAADYRDENGNFTEEGWDQLAHEAINDCED